jgi:hypothetical protein
VFKSALHIVLFQLLLLLLLGLGIKQQYLSPQAS